MKRLLLPALVVVGLSAVALPGTAMAAKGGNSEAAHDCRENWDDYGFRNRGQCVSFFAQDGTLEPTFESTCEGLGGTFSASGQDPIFGTTLAPICRFTGITLSAWRNATTALDPFCPAFPRGSWNESVDPKVLGC